MEKDWGSARSDKFLQMRTPDFKGASDGAVISDLPQSRIFRSILIAFKDDGSARLNTIVRFCFTGPKGKVITEDKPLGSFSIQPIPYTHFFEAFVSQADFTSMNVRQGAVLSKVVVALKSGNSSHSFQLGRTVIDVTSTDFDVQDLVTEKTGCEALEPCN